MNFKKMLSKLNPAVPREWLLVLAGAIWTGVGVMLLRYAVTWLTSPLSMLTVLLGLLGVTLSIAANYFQFSKLAHKNIDRILSYPRSLREGGRSSNDKVCLFAFQAWKGYLVIAVMVTGGILLRSSAIPKPYLAVVYAAIGGALLLASFNYYLSFFKGVRLNAACLDH